MTSRARQTAIDRLVSEAAPAAAGDVELALALHDTVRDSVQFGFTPYFDEASPEMTQSLGVGHCNPQAALMVELFRRAGFEARFQPVTIARDVLRGVAVTPTRLSHVFTEVLVHGRWCRLDSYIVDRPLREAAVGRLRAEGRELGYGCHVDAGDWDGRSDAFSQIATPKLVLEEHAPVERLEDFYRSHEYLHTSFGLRYATWLTPLRSASRPVTWLMNRPVQRIRASSAPEPDCQITA